jgi:NAD(P)-dependent dehydrogenase (short-subunit alcohol dehydrogenase family)
MMNTKNKICIVTGSSQGIGKATATGLARMGAEVVMVSRDHDRALLARDEIIEQTGNRNIHFELADLSSIHSVKELAKRLSARYPAVDVLINNHTALFNRYLLTVDGLEMTFALNHLSYFLLTNLLFDDLKKNAGRIVNVSAHVHTNIVCDFLARPMSPATYNPWDVYCQSKLANILFTYALARRLEGTGATVNCLHPGTAQTLALTTAREIYARLHGPTEFSQPGPLEAAAETSLYLATSPEVQGVSGKYFVNCEAVPSSDLSYDISLQEKLWQLSARLTGLG